MNKRLVRILRTAVRSLDAIIELIYSNEEEIFFSDCPDNVDRDRRHLEWERFRHYAGEIRQILRKWKRENDADI